MAEADLRAEITASIERTLSEEARRNELAIAHLRAIALALVTCLDWTVHVWPTLFGWPARPLLVPLLSSTAFLLGLAVARALHRGHYPFALRVAIPFLDAAVVALLAGNFRRLAGSDGFHHLGGIMGLTAACALTTAAGGLRLRRSAAVLSTALSLAVLILVGATAMRLAHMLYGLSLLLGVGLLSIWMTDIVRRALRSEISRVTLQRFLPDRVLDGAFGDPVGLLTEARSVDATVLVSDLRGFTSLSESLAPAEVLTFLNEIQGALATEVRNHGGVVDKFMGDGMLAVFGTPEPLPDHAARAIHASRAMCHRLAEINIDRTTRGQPTIRLGVGIHSGSVVVGCLGSGTRLEFTVIGDTVNIASRLEGLTKDKGVSILVSDETARRAGAALAGELLPLGEVAVRGRKEPMSVHAA